MKQGSKLFKLICINRHTWEALHFYENGQWFFFDDDMSYCPECEEHYEDFVGSRKATQEDFFPEEY
jgi:hypothetical protein